MLLADRLAERVAGRGRQIIYALIAVVVIAAGVYGIIRWRQRHSQEAEEAIGRAIKEVCFSGLIASSPAFPGGKTIVIFPQKLKAAESLSAPNLKPMV